jgi:hypothetical protein
MADGTSLCEELPWDSAFFGLSIARAIPSRLDAPTRDAMFDWCRSHGTDCLYFLGAPDDTTTIRHLDAGSFQLVGVRVTLARPAEAGRGDVRGHVRRAVAGDIPDLRDIASSAHRDTRFHADSRFGAARSDELYATWIENSVRGYADRVLVAERDRAPAGYLTSRRRGRPPAEPPASGFLPCTNGVEIKASAVTCSEAPRKRLARKA